MRSPVHFRFHPVALTDSPDTKCRVRGPPNRATTRWTRTNGNNKATRRAFCYRAFRMRRMGFDAMQTAPQANAGKHSSRFQLLIGECVLEPVARGERLASRLPPASCPPPSRDGEGGGEEEMRWNMGKGWLRGFLRPQPSTPATGRDSSVEDMRYSLPLVGCNYSMVTYKRE